MGSESTSLAKTADEISSHVRVLELTSRLVGGVALVAFASLHVQVLGLFGEGGIVPLAARIERLDVWSTPSLFHAVGASNTALLSVLLLGELGALGVVLGVLPGIGALVAWASYLSFTSVGWPFLPLQWDALLCESLVLVAITRPWDRVRVRLDALSPVPPLARAAFVLLVCRLHFASGLVKVLGGDPRWADLSALDFHFETQPLPGPLSPLVHVLPPSIHAAMVLATYAIEIGLPLFAWSRTGRVVAFAGFATLQSTIAATGNYGFFNLLSLVLSLPLLDDGQLARFAPWLAKRMREEPAPAPCGVEVGSALRLEDSPPTHRPASRIRPVLVSVAMTLGAIELAGTLGLRPPEVVDSLLLPLRRLEIASPYGPFGVMTTVRREIVFEVTSDGETWHEVEFRYRPGERRRPLPFLPGHLPRLDWMLWFAALGEPEDSPWILAFERALLDGRPDVLRLLSRWPIEGPAQAVRAMRYRYRFAEERDAVWSRDEREPFGATMRRIAGP